LPAALARSVHSPMPFFFLPARWAAERSATGVLAAPFVLATSVRYWDSLLSPLLVALLPLAFTRAAAPAVRLGLAGSLLAWAWAFGNVGRYLYPIAPVLLVEAVRGGVRLVPGSAAWGPGGRPRLGPLRLVLLLPLAYDAVVSFGWAARMNDPMVVALGRESRAAYIRNFLRPAPATFEMGRLLAGTFRPATRYYLAGELRSWSWPGLAWFDVEFATSNLSRWAEAAADPARLRVAFRQRGI